ncbi:hypothetical protein PBI_CHEETOBRO_75 [Mycobacterium phage Cheetobro]|uniref:Uncharacterized protein n=3 Tax=Fionnbharthvirus fionnbharth TaxID=2955891 RepID=A0A1J0ME42_9CAUD|nr:hypothetical protein ACQ59_gp58 [Mycobacterium phage Fionnbharth]YP_009215673.1 hypothetical protein PBI_CHEETOBRO_75 [Mycobacterium phage Cheetobro]ALA46346.1 hypothetical protein PBI_SLARP_75 [Mycobacterium phage Slarp]APD19223.1 hypothetical protein SEA_MITTI_75 [Mycobacterium phage Mitti]ASR87782.1 hypothetical protein WINTERMUTE_75 [Mycobacterium phage Wintermute]AER26366.1 hypothetical protein FIONNBHARTH_75 [Mycobacterium phage Fionnbharth]AII27245.1 hypothetical protein PBI_CHEETOB
MLTSDDFLIDTQMKPSRCRKCGGAVLAGYVTGTMTLLDPAHLSLLGETIALLAGLPTYSIDESSTRRPARAHRRWTVHIRKGLPEDRHLFTVHRCGFVWPPALLDDRGDLRARLYPPTPDECPF